MPGGFQLNPCLHGASETPVSWEEHLSPGRLSSEDLEVSAGKVGTFDLKSMKITAAVLPRSGLRRPGLQRPPPGTLPAALASRQPDSDPAGAQNLWDPNKREREITYLWA
jgi:hypothetical protein